MENLIRAIYRRWKSGQKPSDKHPDEEVLAGFLEAKLTLEESQRIKDHIVSCESCSEIISSIIKAGQLEDRAVPEELLLKVKKNLSSGSGESLMEIALRVKDKAMELLKTTGDILVGQEFVPAPVLRSRSVRDFKDEITILKDFGNVRVQAKVENKGSDFFNVVISVKEINTQRPLKDARVTLVRDDVELESYLNEAGLVTFEHVALGSYRIEISRIEEKVATVQIDIKT
jgi:hypothetical protein